MKIHVIDPDIDYIRNKLDFVVGVSENTGELSNKRVAEYHFCKVVIYDSGLVFFMGSIHKLWNSIKGCRSPNHTDVKHKGFNGNQFTMDNILEICKHLEVLLNCKASQMVFQNIEFGINTEVSFSPRLFLKGVLYHRNKLFEFRYNSYYAESIHQRFILKIYDKSNQYGLKKKTLRVELKIVKTEEIKPLGIKTFNDINSTSMNKAFEMLLKRFDEVVYYDYTLDKNKLNERLKKAFLNYANPRYWNELEPRRRDRHKKRLKNFIKTDSENLKEKIQTELKEKKCVIINPKM